MLKGSNFSSLIAAVLLCVFLVTACNPDSSSSDDDGSISVNGVSITSNATEVVVGATLQLSATVSPSDAANKAVVWSSGDNTKATVSATGLVTGVSAGTVTITVTTEDGDFADTIALTITASDSADPVSVTGVNVSASETSLAAGYTLQLTAAVEPADASNKTVTWSSSDDTKATVSTSGLVTGVAAGTVTITATTTDGDFTGTIDLTITNPIDVTGVTIGENDQTLSLEEMFQLTATVAPADATNKNLTWTSSDDTVATVSETGLVTANKVGSAIITVTTEDGDFQDSVQIEVPGITINAPSTLLNTERNPMSIQLEVDVYPATTVNWISDDGNIATVTDGLVEPVELSDGDGGFYYESGEVTITAQTADSSYQDTVTIIVDVQEPSLDYVLFLSSSTILAGFSEAMKESTISTVGNYSLVNTTDSSEVSFTDIVVDQDGTNSGVLLTFADTLDDGSEWLFSVPALAEDLNNNIILDTESSITLTYYTPPEVADTTLFNYDSGTGYLTATQDGTDNTVTTGSNNPADYIIFVVPEGEEIGPDSIVSMGIYDDSSSYIFLHSNPNEGPMNFSTSSGTTYDFIVGLMLGEMVPKALSDPVQYTIP